MAESRTLDCQTFDDKRGLGIVDYLPALPDRLLSQPGVGINRYSEGNPVQEKPIIIVVRQSNGMRPVIAGGP